MKQIHYMETEDGEFTDQNEIADYLLKVFGDDGGAVRLESGKVIGFEHDDLDGLLARVKNPAPEDRH
jgi:hypothetical protein